MLQFRVLFVLAVAGLTFICCTTDPFDIVVGTYECACERWSRELDYSNGQWIENRDSLFARKDLTVDSTYLYFWNGRFRGCDPLAIGTECSDGSDMERRRFITIFSNEGRLEYRESLSSPASWHGGMECDCVKL